MPDTRIPLPEIPPPVVDLSRYRQRLERLDPVRQNGKVAQVIGLVIESVGPNAMVGEICEIYYDRANDYDPARPPIRAEVVGFRNNRVLLMPLGPMEGIKPGSEVVATRQTHQVMVGEALLGRMLDGLGRPMDGGPPIELPSSYPVNAPPPNAVTRARICEPLQTGVRALDGCLTIGKGQRMGIFAGSGVGKSTLLGMIARNTAADVNVIGLVGERGREVRDFIEENLGAEGIQRSVVVVATSDQPALVRIKAALVATAIAEYFRDRGADVMLMMDSVTRLAMAQREVGLAIGEPPATRGYPPSVFALLPRLLERAGTSDGGVGSITGLYTVLVEGDDMNEPIADTVRGILDGHVVLSRHLAHRGHYPAIDILQSVSRVMPAITGPEHQEAAGALRETLAVYQSAEDLINIGAYVEGSNPRIDAARAKIDGVTAFLRQRASETSTFGETLRELLRQFPPGGVS
ncbi:MAG: flagellar protein export ATPase FliI [Chloroherpetonaceae bacterium]|nr:flagellar protein export ATPase FliI [Chloroherpetonaceae bacterium]